MSTQWQGARHVSRVTRVQEEEVDWEEVEDGDTVYSFSRAAAECQQCGGSSSRHNIWDRGPQWSSQ